MTASRRARLIALSVVAGLAALVVARVALHEDAPASSVAGQHPPASTPSSAAAQPSAPPAAPTPVTSVTPGPAAAPEPPRFDVVRVGARGVVVVAGRAPPGAEVVLLEDGREIGQARADARGEWVILPTEPLAPGSRQFTLRARLAGGEEVTGTEVVVVVVPDPASFVAEGPRRGAEARSAEARPPEVAPATTRQAQPPVTAFAAPARPASGAPAEPRPTEEETRQPAAPVAATATGQAAPAAAAATARSAPVQEEAASGRRQVAAVGAAQARAAGVAEADAEPARDQSVKPEPGGALPQSLGSARPTGPLVVLLPNQDGRVTPRILQGAPSPQRAPQLGLEIVDYDEEGGIRFAGTAPPGATVRVYVDERFAGDIQADSEGRWTLSPREAPAIGRHTLRLDQLAASGTVAARIELPFQRDRLPESAVAEGQVVVQPGNSLWRLARNTYGRGLRYTLIYEANREQIRNPDRIYPGQVFSLPASPTPADSNRSR